MTSYMKCVVIFILSAIVFADSCLACTTFCLKSSEEILLGNNYDFDIGNGLIFVNKRGVRKVSTTADAMNPVRWVSKYGSVTFNQFGRENPNGGMNEKGLAIALMWLDDTVYPKADNRQTLDVLEWIQYQLDTAETTAEVISSNELLRVTSDIKLHYLVNDMKGNTATVEFIHGKLLVHTGSSLTVAALTNDTYERSVDYLKSVDPGKAVTDGSLDRFLRVADKIHDFDRRTKSGAEAVAYAFDMLSDASERGYSSKTSKTYWSIVYDQKRSLIYFRTLHDPSIKTINTKALDYGCASPVRLMDIDLSGTGDITSRFVDYSRKTNRDLIEKSFNGTIFLKDVPKSYRDLTASYPESFPCTGVNR